MRLFPMILLSASLLHSSILIDDFRLNKINNHNEEVTEEEMKNREHNALIVKEINRKFENRKYLETIKLVQRSIDKFHGKEEEELLLLQLKSMHKRKEFSSVVKNIQALDSRNKFTGLNVAKMHILLARIYLETKNFTKFDTEITVLKKNFNKDPETRDTVSILQAWRNMFKGNLTKTIKICERVLVETENLDIGSEAGLILTIVKGKLGESSNHKFIDKIVKFNPEFFPNNPDLVADNLHLFSNFNNLENNISVLESVFPLLNPKTEGKKYRKTVFALVDQFNHKKDWAKSLDYLKELRNHVQGLELLEDKISMEIDEISVLNGTKTIDIVLKENNQDKNKHEYFLVFKLILDFGDKNYKEILKGLKKYEGIRSKTYKKHEILSKYDYLKSIRVELFRDYLLRKKNKEDTSMYTEKRVRGLFDKIRTESKELLRDEDLNLTFLETLGAFGEYELNKEIYEKYKNSASLEILGAVAELLFRNSDIDELLDISERAVQNPKNEELNEQFKFYEYLGHGYKFKKDKTRLKQVFDFVMDKSRHIENENILTIADIYHSFLNEEEPFGAYTDAEIQSTVYKYLSLAAQYPDSKLNKENNYRFDLINRLFKKNSYNEAKFVLDSIVPKDDLETGKRNYFYMKYHKNNGDSELLDQKRQECKSLSDNEWKDKCLNFK